MSAWIGNPLPSSHSVGMQETGATSIVPAIDSSKNGQTNPHD